MSGDLLSNTPADFARVFYAPLPLCRDIRRGRPGRRWAELAASGAVGAFVFTSGGAGGRLSYSVLMASTAATIISTAAASG